MKSPGFGTKPGLFAYVFKLAGNLGAQSRLR